MGFLAPWFLAGIAAVGLPVWLHLLRRHRTTPQPFSSLMFFEPRTQSSIKHRRLRYLLLFALRTALVVLLALAFANPFRRTTAADSSKRKLVIAAIDQSFSMRQGDRLERAKRDAAQLLSTLRPDDRGQVLAFDSQVHAMSEPTDDRAVLQAAAAAVEPTDARGSYAELARALRALAQGARMPIEVHLYSDMQKSSLPPSFTDLRLPESVRLIAHPVMTQRVANFTIENVNVPYRVYSGRKIRLQATIAGYGTEAATRRVALMLNGREVELKSAEVPAGGRAAVEFLSLEAPYGLSRGEVRIEPADAFPADDRFLFSVDRQDPRRALFVYQARSPRALLYFRTALDSSLEPAFAIDPVTPEQTAGIDPGKYAFVVLSDVGSLPQSFENSLQRYVRGGGSLLLALGRDSAARSRVPVFDEGIVDARYFGREQERFQTAAWLDSAHPAIGSDNRWGDVKFYQAVRVEPGKSRIAARLSDNTPLLLEKRLGEGRVLVFASTFDNVSNDFPLHASFVPFIDQIAHYLGRLESRAANQTVGSYLELREAQRTGTAVEVLDPKGRRALSLEEAARAENLVLASAGYYDVRRANGQHDLVAVNTDRHESDLELIPAETLALWQNTVRSSTAPDGGEAPQPKPVSFWWYVMLAVLVTAIAETLVGNRHMHVDKEAA